MKQTDWKENQKVAQNTLRDFSVALQAKGLAPTAIRSYISSVQARAMARINEITKEVLNPMAIMLAYKKGERNFSLSNYFSGEEGEIFISSNTIYKERLPFDLLQTEYEQLTDPSRVFGTFLQ